jgi:dolichol kinase
MFLGGWLFSIGIVWYFIAFGVFSGEITQYLVGITVIALAATLGESFPLRDIDNLSVPAISALVGYIFF